LLFEQLAHFSGEQPISSGDLKNLKIPRRAMMNAMAVIIMAAIV